MTQLNTHIVYKPSKTIKYNFMIWVENKNGHMVILQRQRAVRRQYLHKCTVIVKKHLSVVRIQRSYRRYRTIVRASERLDSVLIIQVCVTCALAGYSKGTN